MERGRRLFKLKKALEKALELSSTLQRKCVNISSEISPWHFYFYLILDSRSFNFQKTDEIFDKNLKTIFRQVNLRHIFLFSRDFLVLFDSWLWIQQAL